MSSQSTLILEIVSAKNKLSMSLYERSSTVHQHEDIFVSFQEIDNLCQEVTNLLNKSNEKGKLASGVYSELKKVGQLLYDQLLTNNIKHKFKSTKIENLLILIDEGLVHIPWELLYDGVQFLCLRFNIGRNVKTRQVLRDAGQKTIGAPIKMLILADPTNDLKSARQEASLIEKELDKKRKTINVAKKVTNLYIQYLRMNIRDYDIVHFAGHADYDINDPSNSGWRLTDGRFTAKDIESMGSSAPLPSIVFSNACQSAQATTRKVDSDSEIKIFGLANAFLIAGVRHYIGTFWKIPDDISASFAKEFYSRIITGMSIGESIKNARLRIIKDFGEDTIIWGSYVLYGDPEVSFVTSISIPHVFMSGDRKFKKLIGAFIALLLIVGLALSSRFYFFKKPLPLSISVLNFKNRDTNEKDSLITYSIIENLDKISSANIVDFLTKSEFNKEKSLADFAKQAGVSRLIAGDYTRKGDSFLVKIRLVDSQTNRILKVKETQIRDDVEMGEKLSLIILDMLKIGLTKEERIELLRKPTDNAKAYRIFAKTWDLFLEGKYEESLELCKKAITIDPNYLDVYKRMGNIYDRMGRREKALDAYSKYAELSKKKHDLSNLANAYANIGWMMEALEKNEEAFSYYKKALEISKSTSDDYSLSKTQTLIGGWYEKNNRYDEAISLFSSSIEINKGKQYLYNHKYQLAANYNHMGIVLSKKEDYDGALEYFNMSLDCFSSLRAKNVVNEIIERINVTYNKLKDVQQEKKLRKNSEKINMPLKISKRDSFSHESRKKTTTSVFLSQASKAILEEDKAYFEAYKLYCQAVDYQEEGKYHEALEVCNKALELNPNYKIILSELGNIYFVLGKWDKALDCYKKYARLCEVTQDKNSLILALNEIGGLYESMEKEKEALNYYNKSRKIATEIGNTYLLASTYRNIAFWLANWEENVADAVKFLSKAEFIYQQAEEPYSLSSIYDDLGWLHIRLYDFDKAESYFSKNLKLLKELNHEAGFIDYYQSMGYLYEYQGEYSEAIEVYKKGLNLARKLGLKQVVLSIETSLADIYRERGDYVDAIQWYIKALEFYKAKDLKRSMASLYDGIAFLYAKINDFDNALENADIAIELYLSLEHHEGLSMVYNTKGAIHFYKKEYDEALEFYNLSLEESRADKIPEYKDYSIYGNIGEVYYKKSDHERALELYNKALKYSEKCKDEPYRAWVYQRIGLAYVGKGLRDAAINYLTRANDLIYKMGIEKEREYLEGIEKLEELKK